MACPLSTLPSEELIISNTPYRMTPPDTIFSPLPDEQRPFTIAHASLQYEVESLAECENGGKMTVIGMEYGQPHPDTWTLHPDGKPIRISNWLAHPDDWSSSICEFVWRHN